MRGRCTVLLVLVSCCALGTGCAPAGTTGVGPGRDTGPTDARDGGVDVPSGVCDATGCTALCGTAGYPSGECTGTGACTCAGGDAGVPSAAGEICGDGLDNNGNGAVDEGCGCEPGSTQSCYPGPRESRNIGACHDGTQPCNPAGEFSHWGECTGFVLPSEERCDDGIDNDCDLAIDEGCGECVPSELGGETICDDGIDNDCDTAVDCFDVPDCPPCCGDEICGDGLDNDCDGFADEDCGSPCAPTEFGPLRCTDGLDNDCDGRTDCEDLTCLPFCCTAEDCGDGLDNDCDGTTDCNDTDCCSVAACACNPVCGTICCAPGTTRYCDTPTYCSWGIQDCRPDGHWGTCEETTSRPTGCDDTSYYYSASCCVDAGACCQNYGSYDPSLPPEASVGNCGDTTCPAC